MTGLMGKGQTHLLNVNNLSVGVLQVKWSDN